MRTITSTIAAVLFSSVALVACNDAGGDESRMTPAPAAQKAPVCDNCGTVAAIEPVKVKGEGSGAGAIAGAIIGGVIGHQFGGGRGKDVATAAGAAGGAYAGHEAEKEYNASTYYRVTVNMETGGTRTVNVDQPYGLTVGSKVRVVGNDLEMR